MKKFSALKSAIHTKIWETFGFLSRIYSGSTRRRQPSGAPEQSWMLTQSIDGRLIQCRMYGLGGKAFKMPDFNPEHPGL